MVVLDRKKNNLAGLLQHLVLSMIIVIRLPIHSPKNTISIEFVNQRHHIIYIPKQLSAVLVASNIIQHYESFISRRCLIILAAYKSYQNNTTILVSNVSSNLRHLYLLGEQ